MLERKEKVTSGSVNILISVNQRIYVFGPERRLDLMALVDVADVPNYERLGKGVQVVDFSRDPAAGVALVPGSFAQVYLTG